MLGASVRLDLGHSPPQWHRVRVVGDGPQHFRLEALIEWHGGASLEVEVRAGSFAVLPEGDAVLDALLPSGIYSHLLSDKHAAVLTSPLSSPTVSGVPVGFSVAGWSCSRPNNAFRSLSTRVQSSYRSSGVFAINFA